MGIYDSLALEQAQMIEELKELNNELWIQNRRLLTICCQHKALDDEQKEAEEKILEKIEDIMRGNEWIHSGK